MKTRTKNTARGLVLLVALISVISLTWAYIFQEKALNICQLAFGKLLDHNGYIEIRVTRQNPTDEIFDATAFFYFPAYQNPPDAIQVERSAGGRFASSIKSTNLVPWSKGKAPPQPFDIGLPTPGISHRRFPFDSPLFEFVLTFSPPIQPKVVRFVNATESFIPVCRSFKASWNEPGQLSLSIQFQRNPFIQTAIIILSLSALAFALLLSRLRTLESLATATASYFLSLWSLRGIVDRTILSFPTLFDMWLLAVAIAVLVIVTWRSIGLTDSVKPGSK